MMDEQETYKAPQFTDVVQKLYGQKKLNFTALPSGDFFSLFLPQEPNCG